MPEVNQSGHPSAWSSVEKFVTSIGVLLSIIVVLTAWVWWAAQQNERGLSTESRINVLEKQREAASSFDIRISSLERGIDRLSDSEGSRNERVTRLEERMSELISQQREAVDHLSKIEDFLYKRNRK